MALEILTSENVGGIDLLIRSLIGSAGVVVLALDLVSAPLSYAVGLLAFLGLYTALTRHCLPYSILGVSTSKKTCEP